MFFVVSLFSNLLPSVSGQWESSQTLPQGPLPSWALQPPVDANFNTGGSVNKQETAIPQQIRVQNSQVAAPLENIENFNRPPLIPPTQQQQQQFNFNFQPQPGVDNTANPFILSPNVPQEGFIQRNLQPQERLPNENSNIPSFERTIVRNNLGQNQPTQFNFQPLRTPNFNGGFHGAPSFEHNANPTVSTTKVPQNITKSALNTSDLTVKVQTSTELIGCGYQEANKKIIGVVYETLQAANIKECVKACQKDSACKSAHFYPDSGECYFNSENRLTRPEMYIEIDPNKPEDQGVIYLEPCNKAEVRDAGNFTNVWKLPSGEWSEWSTCLVHNGKVVRYKYRSPCTNGLLCMMKKSC